MSTTKEHPQSSAESGFIAPNPTWLSYISEKLVLFYMKPLIKKWLQYVDSPKILLVTAQTLDLDLWKEKLQAKSIEVMTSKEVHDRVQDVGPDDCADWDLVVCMQTDILYDDARDPIHCLKPGGAFFMVCDNLYLLWHEWKGFLESQNMINLFPIGFHPKGAIAFWPVKDTWFLWLGKLLKHIILFFPGSYTMGLWWGPCWMISGFKREGITYPQ